MAFDDVAYVGLWLMHPSNVVYVDFAVIFVLQLRESFLVGLACLDGYVMAEGGGGGGVPIPVPLPPSPLGQRQPFQPRQGLPTVPRDANRRANPRQKR